MREEIGRVLAFEPTRAKFSALINLGFIAAGVFFFAITTVIYRNASQLGLLLGQLSQSWPLNPQPGSALSFLIQLSDPRVFHLLAERPGLMTIIAIATVFAVPTLIMLLASDQIGSDVARRHIRFLLPRLSRRGLYFGRALAAWLTWLIILVIACPVMGLILGFVDPTTSVGTNLVYAIWAIFVLGVYGLPFIALMSFANTFISQPFLAYIAAMGTLLVIAMISAAAALVDPTYGLIRYLSPTSFKYLLLTPESALLHTGIATGALLAYTAAFLALGDWILQRRDV